MALLLVAPDRDLDLLAKEIRTRSAGMDVRVWPHMGEVEDIQFAVLWQQPPGLLGQLRQLKAVSSLGAGAEHLLADPDLPPALPVGRLAGRRLAADMAGYLVAQALGHWRGLEQFSRHQAQRQWVPRTPANPPRIGVMGTGRMAQATLKAFKALEVPVRAFNRSGEPRSDISVQSGQDGLYSLAAWSDYLICLLPLTAETRGILNAALFKHMQSAGVLINVGRGEQMVEKDLLTALDDGQLQAAILDVFEHEPLPAQHPFWTHPKVKITPHCASVTSDTEAAGLIIESYQRIMAGSKPLDPVNRALGY